MDPAIGTKPALITRTDIKIEKVPAEEADQPIPEYQTKLNLTVEQIDRLRKEFFEDFEQKDLLRKPHEREWDDRDAQYKGEMEDNTRSEFNLNVPDTATKIDNLVRRAVRAILESDPKFSASARPESVKEGLEEVADKQGDYLDYLFDEEIPLESPLRKTIFSASLYDVGWLKIPFVYLTKPKKREEFYSAQPKLDPGTGKVLEIPGVVSFLQNYPEAAEKGHPDNWVVRDLLGGKDVTFYADFKECIYNNPMPKNMAIRDFWCDPEIESYEELCETRSWFERQPYSFWELKKKEAAGEFENVDKVKYRFNTKENKPGEGKESEIANWKTCSHDILESTRWFDLAAADSDVFDTDKETRIVCWFHRESREFMGAINYPYHYVESVVIPFHIKDNSIKPGIYKGGIAEDIRDMNLAQNALLNFMLTGAWQNLTVTPIVNEGSPVAAQFLEDRWTHGVPIILPVGVNADKGIGFVTRPQTNIFELMNVLLFLAKYNDDRTGINAGASGRESPIDPRAPGNKTAMLLQQTGLNIEDYIKCLIPSVNLIGQIVLKLIYQMSKDGRRFKQRDIQMAVTGGDPFAFITRDEMIAKTNIQSQAAGFAFDQAQDKQNNLALFQLLRGEPSVMARGPAIYQLVRTLIKSWSPSWKNKVDQIWPSPEAFTQQQVQIAIQALTLYAQKVEEQRRLLKKNPPINMQDFMQLFTQLEAAAMTPPKKAEGLANVSAQVS